MSGRGKVDRRELVRCGFYAGGVAELARQLQWVAARLLDASPSPRDEREKAVEAVALELREMAKTLLDAAEEVELRGHGARRTGGLS